MQLAWRFSHHVCISLNSSSSSCKFSPSRTWEVGKLLCSFEMPHWASTLGHLLTKHTWQYCTFRRRVESKCFMAPWLKYLGLYTWKGGMSNQRKRKQKALKSQKVKKWACGEHLASYLWGEKAQSSKQKFRAGCTEREMWKWKMLFCF